MRLNNFQVGGHLVRPAEIKRTKTGKIFARFAVANNPNENEVNFLPCISFDETICEALADKEKGQAIICAGKIRQRNVTNKEGKTISVVDFDTKEVAFF